MGDCIDCETFEEIFLDEKPWKIEQALNTLGVLKQDGAATKLENGKRFKPGDYLCVPDRSKPSTWKLRTTNSPGGSPEMSVLRAAAAALGPKGFRGNKVQLPPECPASKMKSKLRGLYKRLSKDPPDSIKKDREDQLIFFSKDASGVWNWFGIPSNNWVDKAADIITSQAHKNFEKAFDDGSYADRLRASPQADHPYMQYAIEKGMPTLWLWHIPFPIASTEVIAFDDETEMLVAAGKQFEGEIYDKIFEKLSQIPSTELGMSHLMPKSLATLEKGGDGIRYITDYLSTEFTFLPREKAANIGTVAGAALLAKEVDMAIPGNKRTWFVEHLGEELTEAMEGSMIGMKEFADDIDMPRKEIQMEDEVKVDQTEEEELAAEEEETEEVASEVQEEESEEETEEEEVETEEEETAETREGQDESEEEATVSETGEFLIPGSQEEFVGEIVKGMTEAMSGLSAQFSEQIAGLKEEIGTLEAKIGELEKDDSAKIAKAVESTPALSLSAHIAKSVVGNPATTVDYNDERALYKSKPEETAVPEVPAGDLTGLPFIDDIVKRQRANVAKRMASQN